MIYGIGIDLVDVGQISGLLKRMKSGPIAKMFTENELIHAERAVDKAEYLAGRFAAKEAVFKAIARLTKEKSFDFRLVETLNRGDGSPYINISAPLDSLLEKAGISELLISITIEGGLAAAFVIAQ